MHTKERLAHIEKINAEANAYGRKGIAEGRQAVVDPARRDEFQAKIQASFRSGYRLGYATHKTEVTRRSHKRLGRPPKYDFGSVKVDGTLFTTETNPLRVYHCARQWAQRNAPTRKFRVKPYEGGTLITRWK